MKPIISNNFALKCLRSLSISLDNGSSVLLNRTKITTPLKSEYTILQELRIMQQTCQHCGSSQGHLEAHHIVPRQIEINNDTNNLVMVCRKCHIFLESITYNQFPYVSLKKIFNDEEIGFVFKFMAFREGLSLEEMMRKIILFYFNCNELQD